LNDDGDRARKAGDALDAPKQHPNNDQQNDEGNEEVYVHVATVRISV
jgi:hypothetical protein